MTHVLRSQQFSREFVTRLVCSARIVSKLLSTSGGPVELKSLLVGRIMGLVFYESSIRTRWSFETAALCLGMNYISTEDAAHFSPALQGETLEDTVRVLVGYGLDIIVMRHYEGGAADRAAKVCDDYGYSTHVINAGDGSCQHPTQSLVDIYTMFTESQTAEVDGLTVIIGGDLDHDRSARSLAYLLARYKVKIIFVAPPALRIGSDIKSYLEEHHVEFSEEDDPEKALPEADVVYWTRIQRERIIDPQVKHRTFETYNLSLEHMKLLKPKAFLMHPLPRANEISTDVDRDPRAAYFRQTHYGLPVRIALLLDLLGVCELRGIRADTA